MRVETVVSYLRSTGVGVGFISDLIQLQAIYDRIVSGKSWGFLHDTFFFQIDPPVTPVQTFAGTLGSSTLTASAPLPLSIGEYLGREFQHDELPIMVIGVDSASLVLTLNQPLQSDVLAGTGIEFYRREYLPTTNSGRYLSKVRSAPSYQQRSRFGGRVPKRSPIGAQFTHSRTSSTGASEFAYRVGRPLAAPAFAPSIGTVLGGPVAGQTTGRYRAYTAHRMGQYVSELSPASAEFYYLTGATLERGQVSATNNSGVEQIFVVEGALESVDGFPDRMARSGLRVVNSDGTFNYDPNWLVAQPVYRSTASAVVVQYLGQPDSRKNVAVNGWPRRDRIRSVFDEILLDERFLPLWRDLSKHTETGDGKHFMNAGASTKALLEMSGHLL